MALALDDRWVWDFWLVDDEQDTHLFFLQAPKAVGDPELRHWNASVGHAVSRDLTTWTELPTALAPGPPGTWDDASTWTGSVVRDGDGWAMLYTGTSTRDDRLVQRVGLATSPDLVTWTKHDGPVLEADARWYERLDSGSWFDEAWRDPWVHRHDGEWRVLLTARARTGDPSGRGVIGAARSADLRTWEALPPVSAPMGLGQLEVPQLLERDGRWFVVFCSDVGTQSPEVQAEGRGTGTFYLVGDGPSGPFRYGGSLAADLPGSTYAGRLHETGDGLVLLTWDRTGPDGCFVGTIGDPVPVRVEGDRLVVA